MVRVNMDQKGYKKSHESLKEVVTSTIDASGKYSYGKGICYIRGLELPLKWVSSDYNTKQRTQFYAALQALVTARKQVKVEPQK